MNRNRKLFVLFLAILIVGCAARGIHPGSPNQFDSTSYDSLITAHSVIETTKTDLANNAFPATLAPKVKTALNGLIEAYNIADQAYKAYHEAALAGTATAQQQTAVSDGLSRVNAATTALSTAKVATQ